MAYSLGPPRPPDRRTYAPRFGGPPRPPDRGPLLVSRPSAPSNVASAAAAPARRPPVAPPPDYMGIARAQTQAQIDPMLRYLANRYGAQMSGTSSAIDQITGQRASWLGQIPGMTNEAFESAKAPLSGAAQGINAMLTQVGQAGAAREADAMAAAGLPKGAAQSPDINLAKEGRGAGAAAGAIGQAMIDSLAAAQKAAMTYASQLPTFAQQEGEYQKRITLAQISAEMADQMAQTTAEAPQMFWNIYNSLLDRADRDREFDFQVRQYNDQKAAQARAEAQQMASIAAPNAPTVAGRQAYWQTQADKRTERTGYEWVGTSTGIRPRDADPRKPGIQRSWTQQGEAADALLQERRTRTASTRKRDQIAQQNANTSQARARTSQQQADTAARRADTAARAEAHRHAEAMHRIEVAEKNAKTAAQRARIANRRAIEIARNNRAKNAIAIRKAAEAKQTAGPPKPPGIK